MPQKLLDPRDPNPTTGTWSPKGPLPSRVREFGRFPDLDSWRPGDVLLVSALWPDWISRSIQGGQKKGGYDSEDARWHHAAVYIGDASICEAAWSGVRVDSLYSYIGTHLLRVRRDPKLTDDQRWSIVVRALTYLRSSYGYPQLFKLGLQALRGFYRDWGVHATFAPGAVICSQLFADSYAWVTERLLLKGLATPASLSQTDRLEDVDLSWRELPSAPKASSGAPGGSG